MLRCYEGTPADPALLHSFCTSIYYRTGTRTSRILAFRILMPGALVRVNCELLFRDIQIPVRVLRIQKLLQRKLKPVDVSKLQSLKAQSLGPSMFSYQLLPVLKLHGLPLFTFAYSNLLGFAKRPVRKAQR